jgi:hypothetical protein
MPQFDGARHFSVLATVFLVGALIASPYAGGAGWVGVLIGLYFLLIFFNALEARDLKDQSSGRRRRRRR